MGMFPLFSLIKQPKRSNETLFNSKIYRLKLFLKLIKKKILVKVFIKILKNSNTK